MQCDLTDEKISDLMASAMSRLEVADGVQSGLRLRLGARTASWSVFISGPRIERVRVSLGSWPALSVSDARLRAESIWDDYRVARDRELEEDVIEGLLERYADERLVELRSGKEMSRALRVGFAGLLLRYPWAIQQSDVECEIRRIAQSAPQQANRTLAYAKTLFSWAVEKGYLRRNPASNIAAPSATASRSRTLTPLELAMLWDASEQLSSRGLSYPFGQIVKLLILTGLRRSIVSNIKIEDIVMPPGAEGGVWTLSSEKAGAIQMWSISLTPLMRRVIEEALMLRSSDSDLLFATKDEKPISGWSSTVAAMDRVLVDDRIAPWRIDDIRRTYATFSASLPDGADPRYEWAMKVEEWIVQHSSIEGGDVFR